MRPLWTEWFTLPLDVPHDEAQTRSLMAIALSPLPGIHRIGLFERHGHIPWGRSRNPSYI